MILRGVHPQAAGQTSRFGSKMGIRSPAARATSTGCSRGCDGAAREYRAAIVQFPEPAHEKQPERDSGIQAQALGNAWNWLGRALQTSWRPSARKPRSHVRQARWRCSANSLHEVPDASGRYQQELARTRYNRGILFGCPRSRPTTACSERAEADFRRSHRGCSRALAAGAPEDRTVAGSGAVRSTTLACAACAEAQSGYPKRRISTSAPSLTSRMR